MAASGYACSQQLVANQLLLQNLAAKRGARPVLSWGEGHSMNASFMNAAECADRAGRHAFGLNDAKAVAALRQLADDIEAGRVALHGITTSSHATHEEFAVREIIIEVLEECANPGPQMIKK